MPPAFNNRWSVVLHLFIAVCVIACYCTGYIVFNAFWRERLFDRELLFTVHRSSGMLAMLLSLIWLAARTRRLLKTARLAGHARWIRYFQLAMILLVLVTCLCAWVARSMDGRVEELYAFLPVYSFYVRPDSPWAYTLAYWHGRLAHVLAFVATFHMLAGIRHLIDRHRLAAAQGRAPHAPFDRID